MYHTVRIRDLAPASPEAIANLETTRKKMENPSMPKQYWERSIKDSFSYEELRNSSENRYRQTYFEANGPHTHIVYQNGHALFEAYLAAYNAHEDLVLSPDDIWLMITIYYSHYVVKNAEQLRHVFVEHEGKKELVVDVYTMEPE